MAKKRVECPECGHHHTIQTSTTRTTRTRVRATKLPGSNKMQYELSAPPELLETGEFASVTDDILLSGAVGIGVGALGGLLSSFVIPSYSLQIIGTGGALGATFAWSWLCAEYNTRLKHVAPWLNEQRANWQAANIAGAVETGVTLSMDHRYRDVATEAGRTIQYFGPLPVDIERFNEYARAALRGDSLAIAQWTGAGKLFTRPEYDRLLPILRDAGTIVNQPGKGNALTGGGRRAFAQHLKQTPPLPPTWERA